MNDKILSFYSDNISTICERFNDKDADLFWEYPITIEKDWFIERRNNNKLININKEIIELYFPFPWTTFIEKGYDKNNKEYKEIKEFLAGFTKRLSYLNFKVKIFTICQHINFEDILNIYLDLGITDLYVIYSNINVFDNNDIKLHEYKGLSSKNNYKRIGIDGANNLIDFQDNDFINILNLSYQLLIEGRKDDSTKEIYKLIDILNNKKFIFTYVIIKPLIKIITKLKKPNLYILIMKAIEENSFKFGLYSVSEKFEKELFLIYLKMEYYILKNEYSKTVFILNKNINSYQIYKLSSLSINLFLTMINLTAMSFDPIVGIINKRILFSNLTLTNIDNIRLLFKYLSSRAQFKKIDEIIKFYLIYLKIIRIDINLKFKIYFILFNYSLDLLLNGISTSNLKKIRLRLKKLLTSQNIQNINYKTKIQANIQILKFDLLLSPNKINRISENVINTLYSSLESFSNEEYRFKDISGNYHLLIKYFLNKNQFNKAQKLLDRRFKNSKYLIINKSMADDLYLIHRGINTKRFGITAFVIAKNEYCLLPDFFNHYRDLGVEQFIYIDNNSNDESIPFLKKQLDVVLYSTKNDFGEARSGTNWVEYLRNLWCLNSWALYIDPDELLVIPNMKKNNLNILCEYMDSNNYECLHTFMLDLFKPIDYIHTNELNSPEELKELTDKYFYNEYVFTEYLGTPYWEVRGGFRRKLYNENTTLNKNSIFKNKESIRLGASTHYLSSLRPADLNGLLLHKKLLKDETVFQERSLNKDFKLPRNCTIRETKYFGTKNKKESFKTFFSDKKITKLSSYYQLEELGLIRSSKKFQNFLNKH